METRHLESAQHLQPPTKQTHILLSGIAKHLAVNRPHMTEVADGVENSLLGQNDESTAGRRKHAAEVQKDVKKQAKKQVKKMARIPSEMITIYARSPQDSIESASSDE
ncbi:hypothetical protein V8C34DRAFT_308571 [Trichoderma compactum]